MRANISRVGEAREAHALMTGKRDESARALAELLGERAVLQARITAREKELAMAGGAVPDEPFAEDQELIRLDRRVRIGQERVRICEADVRGSEGEINARLCELEKSWAAVGSAVSERLLSAFREGAAVLREAQLAYIALHSYFCQGWSAAAWKQLNTKLAVADPVVYGFILSPIDAQAARTGPPASKGSKRT